MSDRLAHAASVERRATGRAMRHAAVRLVSDRSVTTVSRYRPIGIVLSFG